MGYSLSRRMSYFIMSRRLLLRSNASMIFLFHDISAEDSPQHSQIYSTTPDVFQKQIEYIARNFDVVPLEELVRGSALSTRPRAAITFDDGFRSVLTEAAPRLEALNMPCAAFVTQMAVLNDTL